MTSAFLSLVVSILLLCGVALVSPIFRRIRRAELVLAGDAEQLQQVVSENEAEFVIARQVQQQLYPDEDPQVEGLDISGRSIPARSASGDYFDYLPLPDGALVIVVGDSSGHGMGAALLATETRAYLHAASHICNDPAEILAMTNRFLCEHTARGQFVTLLIVRAEVSSGVITVASAGHPAFLLHQSGEIETLEADGIPLGIDRDVHYSTSTSRQLASGDILLLCSDGLWEAHALDDSLFGLERAFEVVKNNRDKGAREIVASLFQSIEDFTERMLPTDDVTVLVVKA